MNIVVAKKLPPLMHHGYLGAPSPRRPPQTPTSQLKTAYASRRGLLGSVMGFSDWCYLQCL